MEITRQDAIKILEELTSMHNNFYDDLIEKVGLFDERNDDWPDRDDVMLALGITKDEYEKES